MQISGLIFFSRKLKREREREEREFEEDKDRPIEDSLRRSPISGVGPPPSMSNKTSSMSFVSRSTLFPIQTYSPLPIQGNLPQFEHYDSEFSTSTLISVDSTS